MNTEHNWDHFAELVNILSIHPEYATHIATFEKYALLASEQRLSLFIDSLIYKYIEYNQLLILQV